MSLMTIGVVYTQKTFILRHMNHYHHILVIRDISENFASFGVNDIKKMTLVISQWGVE